VGWRLPDRIHASSLRNSQAAGIHTDDGCRVEIRPGGSQGDGVGLVGSPLRAPAGGVEPLPSIRAGRHLVTQRARLQGGSGFGVGTSMGVLAAEGRIAPWGPHAGPQQDRGVLPHGLTFDRQPEGKDKAAGGRDAERFNPHALKDRPEVRRPPQPQGRWAATGRAADTIRVLRRRTDR